MALVPVSEALAHVLEGVCQTAEKYVETGAAHGRVLAADLASRRDQPPFDMSAMDGYAVRACDVEVGGEVLAVIGEVAAGGAFPGEVGPGEAVRIFTGAPVPPGADGILIQEHARAAPEDAGASRIVAQEPVEPRRYIRPRGLDFKTGERLLRAGTRLGSAQVALAAAMDYARLPVRRRPRVAILSNGDELVAPADPCRPPRGGSIVASNAFGVGAIVATAGGIVSKTSICGDDRAEIRDAIAALVHDGPEILITIGGVSVGKYDLVRRALADNAMDVVFWKIAMRPGKPLVYGRIGATAVLGLPGNPVSAMITALVFVRPLIHARLGLEVGVLEENAVLAGDVKENDERQDYLRAHLSTDRDGRLSARAFGKQDSAMLGAFAAADGLIVRPPFAPKAQAGERCRVLRL